jgi:enoyl-[acyl-carrier protein] reductase II
MESFAAKQREVAMMLDGEQLEMAEAQLQIEHYWAGALRRAVIDGDVETGSVMAGQSVGMVKAEQSIPEIVAQLVDEAAQALEGRSSTPDLALAG